MSTLFLGTIAAVSTILFPGQILLSQEIDNQSIMQEDHYMIPGGGSLLARNELSLRRSVAVIITCLLYTSDAADE